MRSPTLQRRALFRQVPRRVVNAGYAFLGFSADMIETSFYDMRRDTKPAVVGRFVQEGGKGSAQIMHAPTLDRLPRDLRHFGVECLLHFAKAADWRPAVGGEHQPGIVSR